MPDTRPEMTRAGFAAAPASCHDRWWLTGEDHFLHVPAVMEVEGWNLYGHEGNRQLTEPQRVLMMWSDLVGQTQNGGFVQFVDNFEQSLGLAHALIAKLEWPELFERFDRAFREQAGDPRKPRIKRRRYNPFENDWRARRDRFLCEVQDRVPWMRVPMKAADAFDDWFYRDETKAASKVFIGGYIVRHRDALCRLTD